MRRRRRLSGGARQPWYLVYLYRAALHSYNTLLQYIHSYNTLLQYIHSYNTLLQYIHSYNTLLQYIHSYNTLLQYIHSYNTLLQYIHSYNTLLQYIHSYNTLLQYIHSYNTLLQYIHSYNTLLQYILSYNTLLQYIHSYNTLLQYIHSYNTLLQYIHSYNTLLKYIHSYNTLLQYIHTLIYLIAGNFSQGKMFAKLSTWSWWGKFNLRNSTRVKNIIIIIILSVRACIQERDDRFWWQKYFVYLANCSHNTLDLEFGEIFPSNITCYMVIHCYSTYTHIGVNLDFKGKQDNKPEIPFFYFHRKKAAQVGFEHTTSCFQGSRSTN